MTILSPYVLSRRIASIQRYTSARCPTSISSATRTRPPRLSSILEENTTITFETIFNAEKRTAGGGMDISFEDFYRVVLHYSGWAEDKLVTQKVVQAVPLLTFSEALRVVENAHRFGSAIVKTLPLEEAVMIRANLTRQGLKATIEIA